MTPPPTPTPSQIRPTQDGSSTGSGARSIEGANYALLNTVKFVCRNTDGRVKRYVQEQRNLQAEIASLRRCPNVRGMTAEEKASIDEDLRKMAEGFDPAFEEALQSSLDALDAFDTLDILNRFISIDLDG